MTLIRLLRLPFSPTSRCAWLRQGCGKPAPKKELLLEGFGPLSEVPQVTLEIVMDRIASRPFEESPWIIISTTSLLTPPGSWMFSEGHAVLWRPQMPRLALLSIASAIFWYRYSRRSRETTSWPALISNDSSSHMTTFARSKISWISPPIVFKAVLAASWILSRPEPCSQLPPHRCLHLKQVSLKRCTIWKCCWARGQAL